MRRSLCILVLAACSATPALPVARFANAPAVNAVDDRHDVPAKPGTRDFLQYVYHYDGIWQRRVSRALELPADRRARGVNALDEVPDSTWFTNRIGTRELTLEELARGPNRIDNPDLHFPWTVRSTKPGGTEIGFVITDARGVKFLLKFDPLGMPEQETATHVIVGKLLWACGYNVTEDYVVYFRPGDLVLAPDAVIKDADGGKRKLDAATLARRLAEVEHDPDGRIRGMASRWLDGKPLGGHPAEGVRDDDPNDRIPHEQRRDLRGAYAIFEWLDHVDVQEGNFIDAWVADHGRHYVLHYLIDFGKSLGVMATTGHDPRHGHTYVVDLAEMTGSLLSAGIVVRPWEYRTAPQIRGVGLFDVDTFDPGAWKPDSPAYVPFLTADRVDKLWGARILMRFTPAQLRAIVETGRFSDPRATDYVTATLIARQRAVARYWFAQTNPLDHFTVDDHGACFDDLARVYALDGSPTHYAITTYDREEHVLGRSAVAADLHGHTCTGPLALAPGGDGYTIVEIETRRPAFTGRTFVHVARDPATHVARVIGVWRP
jgi:hypothetical protein